MPCLLYAPYRCIMAHLGCNTTLIRVHLHSVYYKQNSHFHVVIQTMWRSSHLYGKASTKIVILVHHYTCKTVFCTRMSINFASIKILQFDFLIHRNNIFSRTEWSGKISYQPAIFNEKNAFGNNIQLFVWVLILVGHFKYPTIPNFILWFHCSWRISSVCFMLTQLHRFCIILLQWLWLKLLLRHPVMSKLTEVITA